MSSPRPLWHILVSGSHGGPIHHFGGGDLVFAGGVRIDKLALPTALQHRAFELLGALVPVRVGGS